MKSILVVDDVHDLADSAADLLRLLGYTTRTAYNGRDAIEFASAKRPDIVLLDLNMPIMDGFEAALAIRSQYTLPPPLIIAVSALAGPAVEHKLRQHGFDHYVTKPADVVQLIAMVEQRRV